MRKHSETQKRHEDTYRKTIDGALRSIDQGQFTQESVPRILNDLRAELGQCIELLLISSEFYAQQMERLQMKVSQELEV